MIKKELALLLIIFSFFLGSYFYQKQHPAFATLSSPEMQERIVAERNFAILKVTEEGNYKCCIKPACTMCYMEANKWNNFTAGTCACDDLIAAGEDPCPQCISGLCEAEEKACDINKGIIKEIN